VLVVEVLNEDVAVIGPKVSIANARAELLDRNRVSSRRYRQMMLDRKRPIAAALVVDNSIILPALLQILQSDRPHRRPALFRRQVRRSVM
jgi:hypothetical protein